MEEEVATGRAPIKEKNAKLPFAKELMSLNPNECDFQSCIEDTLIITMKGIAAGMQNTG
jgi:hypothetical protein